MCASLPFVFYGGMLDLIALVRAFHFTSPTFLILLILLERRFYLNGKTMYHSHAE